MRFANPAVFFLVIPAALLFLLYIKNWIGKEPVLKFSSVKLVKSALQSGPR